MEKNKRLVPIFGSNYFSKKKKKACKTKIDKVKQQTLIPRLKLSQGSVN